MVGASLIMGLFRGGGWRAPLSAGFATQVAAGGLNEVTHRLPELEESILHFTAHAMFTLGLLSSSLTIFVAICIHTLFSEKVGAELHLCHMMSGVALWLTASGSILYIADTTPAATVLLGFTSATILGSVVYSSLRAYAGTLAWTMYTVSVYFFTVGYVGGHPYIPIGFITTLLADVTKRRTAGKHYIRLAMVALLAMTAHLAYPTYITRPLQLVGLGLGGLIGGVLLAYVGGRLASGSRYPAMSRSVKM